MSRYRGRKAPPEHVIPKGIAPYPSFRVLYGTHGGEWPAHGNQEYVPQFERALAIEKDLVDDGFCVAYHLIPAGAMNGAIILYEANAVLAELLYGVDHFQVLPRFNPEDFMEWPDVPTMLPQWGNNDHDPRWRRIGIACSPSLFSNTEAPPYSMFSFGYGASNPDVKVILTSTLECFTGTAADKLGGELAAMGKKLFANVGGSMIQIFVHRDVAPKYMFLSQAMGVLVSHGAKMLTTLDSGDLSTIQIRLIVNPEVFINEKHGRIFQYHSKEEEYIMAKSAFKDYIIQRLLASKVALPYLSDPTEGPKPRLAQLRKDNSTLRLLDSAQLQLTEEELALNYKMFERRNSELLSNLETDKEKAKDSKKASMVKRNSSTLRHLRSALGDIDEEELALNMEYFNEKDRNKESSEKKRPREDFDDKGEGAVLNLEKEEEEERPTKRLKRDFSHLRRENSILKALRSAQVEVTYEDMALNMEYFGKKEKAITEPQPSEKPQLRRKETQPRLTLVIDSSQSLSTQPYEMED